MYVLCDWLDLQSLPGCVVLFRLSKLCVLCRLDSSNVFEFPVKWERGKGLDPTNCQPHEGYLSRMCERVRQSLEQQISLAADTVNRQTCHTTYQETLTHGVHCQTLLKSHMVHKKQISFLYIVH